MPVARELRRLRAVRRHAQQLRTRLASVVCPQCAVGTGADAPETSNLGGSCFQFYAYSCALLLIIVVLGGLDFGQQLQLRAWRGSQLAAIHSLDDLIIETKAFAELLHVCFSVWAAPQIDNEGLQTGPQVWGRELARPTVLHGVGATRSPISSSWPNTRGREAFCCCFGSSAGSSPPFCKFAGLLFPGGLEAHHRIHGCFGRRLTLRDGLAPRHRLGIGRCIHWPFGRSTPLCWLRILLIFGFFCRWGDIHLGKGLRSSTLSPSLGPRGCRARNGRENSRRPSSEGS
mmetsp:Transcript_58648/g.191243  ORF Transcript_58648/g.191243 Transcript_58648/m.191243 type:complete len:287 (+) Transcript_58648:2184-3044(+)